MATLTHLVTAMAWITGLPRSNVFAYGRFAREAGHISQNTRGPGAATMNVRDAANLVLAVCGTDVTREAGRAIETLRPMKGAVFFADEFMEHTLSWLAPLGIKKTTDWVNLKADFGSVLEFLITAAASGELHKFLSAIPYDTRFPSFRSPWKKSFSKNLGPYDAMAQLHITFNRSGPIAEIKVERWWNSSPELVLSLAFVSSDDFVNYGYADIELSCQISAATLAALGFTIMHKQLPTQSPWPPLLPHFFPENVHESS